MSDLDGFSERKRVLKKACYDLLKKKRRISTQYFWSELAKRGGIPVVKKYYGVTKMSVFFSEFSDILELTGDGRYVKLAPSRNSPTPQARQRGQIDNPIDISDSDDSDFEPTSEKTTYSSLKGTSYTNIDFSQNLSMTWGSGACAAEDSETRPQSSKAADFLSLTGNEPTRNNAQTEPSFSRYGLSGSSNINSQDRSQQNPVLPPSLLQMNPRQYNPSTGTMFIPIDPRHQMQEKQHNHPLQHMQQVKDMEQLSRVHGQPIQGLQQNQVLASPALIAPPGLQFIPTLSKNPGDEWPKPWLKCGPPPGSKLPEPKKHAVAPLNLPKGMRLRKEDVDEQAKECIEILANSGELVTIERIESMLCLKYQVNSFQALRLPINHCDQLPSVTEHSRLVGKVNAYVNAFARSQSICTLYELSQCCSEFHPEKKPFQYLKLGPLQKFQTVFNHFRFPTDEFIPEITTVDVLDRLADFLDKNNTWTKKVELDDFLGFLKDFYNVETPFSLGIRLKSLPLAIQQLKKSKRDAANSKKDLVKQLESLLQKSVHDAFQKLRSIILQKSRDGSEELRSHYMNLKPEQVLNEIFGKFNLLAEAMQGTHSDQIKLDKFRRCFESLMKYLNELKIPKMLFHLAICLSSTDVLESTSELKEHQQQQEAKEQESKQLSESRQINKQPPTKASLIEKVFGFIRRVLEHGSFSLSNLHKIESKVLEDLNFDSFQSFGYGSFLEFITSEARLKQQLTDSGATMLGSSATDSDHLYKVSRLEVLELVLQAKHAGAVQNSEIETVLCEHYKVHEVKHLGQGNLSAIIEAANRPGKHSSDSYNCHFETALLGKQCQSRRNCKVGIQGKTSREDALACLTACPLLEDLSHWSLWHLVFEPEHGPLRKFVEKNGGYRDIPLPDGRIAKSDFLLFESEPGKYLKISARSTIEDFQMALESNRPDLTAGHLVSLMALNQGLDNVPVALMANHVKGKLVTLNALSVATQTPGGPPSPEMNQAVLFITNVLLLLPVRTAVASATKLFLEPLSSVVGAAKSKVLVKQACVLPQQQQKLELLGCLLGLTEWESTMNERFKFPPENYTSLEPDELESVTFPEPTNEQSEDDEESSESDIDDILSEEGDDETCQDDDQDAKCQDKDENSVKSDEAQILDSEEKEDIENPEQIVVGSDVDDSSNEANDSSNETSESLSDEDEPAEPEDPCHAIVNAIRADEFGEGVDLDDKGKKLLQKQQERQGRSLDRLSKDLYTKDTHFVLELIQNADDNPYCTHVNPALKFIIDESGILILNNEMGFEEKNVRALCDVGKSTKSKHQYGYIGQKGIGFKSVFRVTTRPEVHSNGFHICFDLSSGPVGYILPHWIDDLDRENQWQTRIYLPWSEEIKAQIKTHAARFNDIQPTLLLFLHRLQEIEIENRVEGSTLRMKRNILGDGKVEITHSYGLDKWLVLRKTLAASHLSSQVKSGADVESTEIALAFPLKNKIFGHESQRTAEKLPVFAFLPLRSYGFRFIIQGDFDIPSSREDVNKDSSWNQWLRNEIPALFMEAFDSFMTTLELSPVKSLLAFLKFVPMEGEVLDFFRPVSNRILDLIRAKECMPVLTKAKNEDEIQWKIPSKTVIVRDALVHEVVTPDLLQQHLALHYLHPEVVFTLDDSMAKALQIETITTEHLLQIGASITSQIAHESTKDKISILSKWLACVYRSLDDFADDSHLTTLSKLRCVPLLSGELVSLGNAVVFMLTDDGNSKNSKKNKARPERNPLEELKKDLNLVDPGVYRTGDDEINSQVVKLLRKIGVKELAPHDLIHKHIIPAFQSDQIKTKSRETIMSYLIYIQSEFAKDNTVINLEELKSVVKLVTNQGILSPLDNDIHFSSAYDTIDLTKCFPKVKWTIIEGAYLPARATAEDIMPWRRFLSALEVSNFLRVRKSEVVFDKSNIHQTAWSGYKDLVPDSPDGYSVMDFHCEEFYNLVSTMGSDQDAMMFLFTRMNELWDKHYHNFAFTQLKSPAGHVLKETIETSFAVHLKTLKWIPSIYRSIKADELTESSVTRSDETYISDAKGLFVESPDITKYLGHTVRYLAIPPPKASSSFTTKFLNIQAHIKAETIKDALISWGHRKSEQTKPTVFCTSINHIIEVYYCLRDNLRHVDLQNLFHEHPVIFLPKVLAPAAQVVVGEMLFREEVWWSDPTGLFNKYKDTLKLHRSPLAKFRTLANKYGHREINEIFHPFARVKEKPSTIELAELLKHISQVSNVTDEDVLQDALHLFSSIGEQLAKRNLTGENYDVTGYDLRRTEAQQEGLNMPKVVEMLTKSAVFPSKSGHWISLSDRPLIADNSELEKMFEDKPGVYFLNLEPPNIIKADQKEAYSKNIKLFTDLFPDIEYLRDCIETEEITSGFFPCSRGQTYLHNIIGLLQRFLFFNFPQVYLTVKDSKASILQDIVFSQVDRLEMKYKLKDRPDVFEIKSEKCVIKDKNFYFQTQYVGNQVEVNKQLAKYFAEGNDECVRELQNFLHQAVNILEEKQDETIESLLSRQRTPVGILPADEPVWEIPLPTIPVEKLAAVTETEMTYGRGDGCSTTSSKGDEEDSKLKSWPPTRNESSLGNRNQINKPKKKSIWEPPKAPDFFKESKKLPANIQMEEKTEQTPTERSSRNQDTDQDETKSKQVHDKPKTNKMETQTDNSSAKQLASKPGGASETTKKQCDSQSSSSVKGDGTVSHSSSDVAARGKTKTDVDSGSKDQSLDESQGSGKRKINELSDEEQMNESKRPNTNDQNDGVDQTEPMHVSESQAMSANTSTKSGPYLGEKPFVALSLGEVQKKREMVNLDNVLPVWEEKNQELDYDELARGNSLTLPTYDLDNASTTNEIGRWGELLVLDYLQQQVAKPQTGFQKLSWVNESRESGFPYDFELIISTGDTDQHLFIEVKTTIGRDKATFEVSPREVEMAMSSQHYQIIRVFGAGSNSCSLVRVNNVAEKLLNKSLQLYMRL